jgi:hypothetical protein
MKISPKLSTSEHLRDLLREGEISERRADRALSTARKKKAERPATTQRRQQTNSSNTQIKYCYL